MRMLTSLFFLFTIITIASCTKENNLSSTTDFSGKYHGPTIVKVSSGGQTVSGPYDLILDISKGTNSQEIKILFGNWLTMATLNGNKFTIQPVTFPGAFTTTGSGEFTGTKLIINYNQQTTNETINYSGTITKF